MTGRSRIDFADASPYEPRDRWSGRWCGLPAWMSLRGRPVARRGVRQRILLKQYGICATGSGNRNRRGNAQIERLPQHGLGAKSRSGCHDLPFGWFLRLALRRCQQLVPDLGRTQGNAAGTLGAASSGDVWEFERELHRAVPGSDASFRAEVRPFRLAFELKGSRALLSRGLPASKLRYESTRLPISRISGRSKADTAHTRSSTQ